MSGGYYHVSVMDIRTLRRCSKRFEITMKISSRLLEALQRELDGEVLTDSVSRALFATDASPYQQLPIGVVRPFHRQDCVRIMQFAARHRVPLIPRGAGTSLAGQ